MHGLTTKEDESKNKVKKCGRCMKLTPLGAKVCPFCAMPLTMEAAMEQKEKLENLEALMPFLDWMKKMQPLVEEWAKEKGIVV